MPTYFHENDTFKPWILLYGAPKQGKTVCAATLSAKFPATLPAKDLTLIDDMYWLLSDRDGLRSLLELGISVPYKDLTGIMSADELKAKWIEGIKEAGEMYKAGKLAGIVDDTLTTRAFVIEASLKQRHKDTTANYWYDVWKQHADFLNLLHTLPVPAVLLAHAKAAESFLDDSTSAATKKAIMGQQTGATVTIDISGKAAKYIRNQASFIFPIIKKVVKNRPPEFVIRPYDDGRYDAGVRVPYNKWKEEEPANLRKLLLGQ